MNAESFVPRVRPLVLLILDGWGIGKPSRSNPYSIAKLPNYEDLILHYPAIALQASGESVGLPWGEMGNSEVGHVNWVREKSYTKIFPGLTGQYLTAVFSKTQPCYQLSKIPRNGIPPCTLWAW
ncbi:MAG: hypothetical protein WC270_01345 [Patescibacteria group bacterium]|jgi:hypothetical protein